MKNIFLCETAELLKNICPENIHSHENIDYSVNQFLDNLSKIGRGEVKTNDFEKALFLSETSNFIKDASMPLHQYLFATEDMLTHEFYGNEWINVCNRRSNIEFLRNMYHDFFDSDWDLFLDCENLDDMLQQKGDFEGGFIKDKIPEGIPTSHWWWWYPEKPPL